MRTTLLRVLRLWLVLFVAWPGGASAEGLDPETAEVLFQKGRAAMVAQDYDSACRMLQDSFELDPAPGTLMNLAVCEDKRGHLVDSWERWQEALDLLDADDSRRVFVHEQLHSLHRRLGRLKIRLSPEVPSQATVIRDGTPMKKSEFDEELLVDPGAHLIIVKSKDHEERRYHFPMDPGQTKELTVTVGKPLAGTETAPTSSGFWSRKNRKIMGYSSLAVGAVGVVGAIVTGVLLPQKQQIVDENCDEVTKLCRNEEGDRAAAQGRTLLALNTASWVVAGVGLAAGSAVLLTLPFDKNTTQGSSPGGSVSLALSGSTVELFGSF